MIAIECYGLPGSGKTFLAKYLEEGLHRKGMEVVNRDESIKNGLIARDDGQISNLCKRYLPETQWQRVVNKDLCLQEFWDYLGDHLDFGHVVFTTLHNAQLPKEHVRSIIGSICGTCVEYQLLGNISEDFKSKILIADDELNVVKLLSARLRANDYEVIAAYDGAQAIQKAHKEKPDLIIMDIRMPAGSGGKTV